MLRLRALLLGALALTIVGAGPPPPVPYVRSYVGPTAMLLSDADSVLVLATEQWQSPRYRDQEKLLRTELRMTYWRDHLPSAMRRVFDTLGYPTGRLLLTPVGHSEEEWFYGQLSPPLVFRDGVLQNPDRLDQLLHP
jgi:hypothetical protein